jgi:hypothetical protein
MKGELSANAPRQIEGNGNGNGNGTGVTDTETAAAEQAGDGA